MKTGERKPDRGEIAPALDIPPPGFIAEEVSSPPSPGFADSGRAIYIDRGRKAPKFIDGEEV
jgi:hypothetical protein